MILWVILWEKKYGLYKFDVNNEIIKDNNFENINNELNTSGYFITNIDPSLCDTILDKLKKTKCKNISPTTIWCEDMSEILNIDEIQNLVTDSNLLTIVQNFLNCKPILSQTNYWKSITGKTNDATLSKNAQKFHRDFEYILAFWFRLPSAKPTPYISELPRIMRSIIIVLLGD